MSLFFSTIKRSEVATEDFLVAVNESSEIQCQLVDLANEALKDLDTIERIVETQAVVASESFDNEAIVQIINTGRALEV